MKTRWFIALAATAAVAMAGFAAFDSADAGKKGVKMGGGKHIQRPRGGNRHIVKPGRHQFQPRFVSRGKPMKWAGQRPWRKASSTPGNKWGKGYGHQPKGHHFNKPKGHDYGKPKGHDYGKPKGHHPKGHDYGQPQKPHKKFVMRYEANQSLKSNVSNENVVNVNVAAGSSSSVDFTGIIGQIATLIAANPTGHQRYLVEDQETGHSVRWDSDDCRCRTKEEIYEWLQKKMCVDQKMVWHGMGYSMDQRCLPKGVQPLK